MEFDGIEGQFRIYNRDKLLHILYGVVSEKPLYPYFNVRSAHTFTVKNFVRF